MELERLYEHSCLNGGRLVPSVGRRCLQRVRSACRRPEIKIFGHDVTGRRSLCFYF